MKSNKLMIITAASLVVTGLNAQESQERPPEVQTAGPDQVIEEITVTSTRIETDLMTTSIAVSAFSQEDLIKAGVKDIRDASSLVPNFDVAFSPSDSGVQLSIRGVNNNNFTELSDPTVAFHVDGIYSPRPQGATALMFDIERLEVMRGPQGTLFGRNSAAGSVDVITAKPTMDGIYATVGVEVGNRDQRAILGTFNLPVTDTLALRANFFGEKRDGFADHGSGRKDLEGIGVSGPDGIPDMDQRWNHPVSDSEKYGAKDRYAARISGLWEPTDRFSWRLTYEYAEDKSPGWPIAPDCDRNPEVCAYNGGSIDYVDPNVPGEMDMTNDAVRSRIDFSLTDDINLMYNFGWARQQRSQQWDGDMGWRPVPGPTTGWLNRREPWPSLFLNTDDSDYKSWIHEVQLQGLTGRVNWIVGVFNLKEDNEIVFDVELPFCCTQGAAGGISFIQPERKLDSEAIFGQATWHATDKWHFTVGGRYYEDTKQDNGGRNIGCFGSSGCSFSRGQIPNDGFPQTEEERDPLLLPQFTSADLGPGMGSQDRFNNYELLDKNDNKEDFSSFDWRLGVDYDLTSDTFLYLYAARGSKAGSLGDGVDVCRCGRIEFFNFDPEEVLNYELGYKGSLFDNKVSLRAALFFTDYKDKQVTQFRNVGFVEDPPGAIVQPPQEIGTQVTSNAGAAEIFGFELEWDIIPWENGRIGGGIGVLDSEITEWDGYLGEIHFCDDREDVSPAYACIPADEDSPGEPGVVGNELPYAVPVTFTLTYEHNFTLPGGYRLTPWTKFHWEDEMHFTEGNFDGLDAYSDKRDDFAIVDATLRLTSPDETWHVEAFVYNITDERFPTYYQLDRPTAGAPLYAWNEPRSWGVRFAYNVRPQ